MNLKLSTFNLRLATGTMLVISTIIVALGLLLPVGPAAVGAGKLEVARSSVAQATTETVDSGINLSDLVDVELRKPLVDVRPTTIPSAAGVNATFGLRLIGTIIEPAHSFAVFSDAGGKTQIKSVGEKAGGADIIVINSDSVTLRLSDRLMVLHAVKPATAAGPSL